MLGPTDWLERLASSTAWRDGRSSVEIGTLDNPGWRLNYTMPSSVDSVKFPLLRLERSDIDWVHVFTRDNVFHAVGGRTNLVECVLAFRAWRESSSTADARASVEQILQSDVAPPDDALSRLSAWYASFCDGDWEHAERIRIVSTLEGWSFRVGVDGTPAAEADARRRWAADSSRGVVEKPDGTLMFETACAHDGLARTIATFLALTAV